ncbi:MAG TPA: ACP S-malonyltransferase [Polyangiaceae bacterium]|jgi:[acyl-carrier-protein] S-malonyltransferase|nr:ACP S-malonyltransferase [Polyangiaceae bacterium]
MKVAWLFPGQGAQKVGMGADVAETFSAARAIFEEANRSLDFDITRLCFEGPESDLTLTANTQPALVTVSSAIVAALKQAHGELPVPFAAAGHSLGEYSALVAAGSLAFSDAVRIVRLRGSAMQEAVPQGQGAMLALIGASEQDVRALCDEAREADVLSPANFNCPGQIVIAGHAEAVERAKALAGSRKMKAIPLKVSAPFHCALMQPAALAVERALGEIATKPLLFPVVSNVLGEPNQDASQVRDLLVRQIDGAVRWEQTIRWLVSQGVTHALELGPGQVLAGLVKKTDKALKVLSVGDVASISEVPSFLAS